MHVDLVGYILGAVGCASHLFSYHGLWSMNPPPLEVGHDHVGAPCRGQWQDLGHLVRPRNAFCGRRNVLCLFA